MYKMRKRLIFPLFSTFLFNLFLCFSLFKKYLPPPHLNTPWTKNTILEKVNEAKIPLFGLVLRNSVYQLVFYSPPPYLLPGAISGLIKREV